MHISTLAKRNSLIAWFLGNHHDYFVQFVNFPRLLKVSTNRWKGRIDFSPVSFYRAMNCNYLRKKEKKIYLMNVNIQNWRHLIVSHLFSNWRHLSSMYKLNVLSMNEQINQTKYKEIGYSLSKRCLCSTIGRFLINCTCLRKCN